MNKFKNTMKFSIDIIQQVAVARSCGRHYQTPTMSGLLVNELAKQGRRISKDFQRHHFVTSALVLAIALTLTIASEPTSAADSVSCGINEVTFTSGGFNTSPSISGDGTRIAFTSTRDLTGNNSDGNSEIFLFDTTTNKSTQITNTTGNSPGILGNSSPEINSDGTRIVFQSDRDLTGGNADGNPEIVLYDITANSFTQITNTTGIIGNNQPAINRDGTRIAFRSDRDLTGNNADANAEVFLFDTTTNNFTQITNTTGGGIGGELPAISGDGTRIAFDSNKDLTGGNADLNVEVFLYDTKTNSITQVTNTTGAEISNRDQSMNGDGTRIAFTSNGFPTGNPDGNDEIFLFNSITGGIAQITFTTGKGLFDNGTPSINSDGTRVAFQSTRDLTGGNGDGNFEIFLVDTTTNSFTQVTNLTGQSVKAQAPGINSDGTRIVFVSTGFPNIGNADGNSEIFLAACLVPPPPPPATFADLVISQGADKTSVKQGDRLTYTITVKNSGPDSAIGAVINDTLSSGVTFVSAKANKGSIAAPPVGETGTVTWDLGDLQNGAQEAAQIQVSVIIRGKTTLTNTATVASSTTDPNQANNSSSLTTTVQAGGKK